MLLILTPLYKMNYIILCFIICNLNATSQLPYVSGFWHIHAKTPRGIVMYEQ